MTKMVEEVNKEVAKMVEEVNKELVLDKEADIEVNQEVDKEVANVVDKFSYVGRV